MATGAPSLEISQTAQVVLVAVTLLFLFGFWIWVMYGFNVNTPANVVYLTCPKGLCPTNIYNGEKRCSQDESLSLIYDPAYETCNSRTTCESPLTPYALLPDGSTNELGACATGETCRCVSHPQCSIQTMTIFSLTNGSTYLQDPTSSRGVYQQIPLSFQGDVGSPFTYLNPNTQFCAIKAYHLNRIAPGACTFANPTAPTTQEIRTCLSLNPCMVGVLAFTPLDASTFTLTATDTRAIYTVPVACVTGQRGPLCGPTSVPVWDQSRAQLICYDTRT